MILAVDVNYRGSNAVAAGVLFQNWEDSESLEELIVPISTVAEYKPGQFYRRELPGVLELLKQLDRLPEYIIIDGHVYLDGDKKPGLGKYLYDALQGSAAIIGVAKNRFRDTPSEAAVFRCGSKRALYVTAAGIEESDAQDFIMRMHGEHRLPTILRRVDQLSRAVGG
jgi:deoxyribonuclease V